MRKVVAGLATLAVGAMLAGCSSSTTPQAAGNTPAATDTSTGAPSPGPAPTGPSAALCTAARTLVAGAQPTFADDADADIVQQATDDAAFYGQLLGVLGTAAPDPVSLPVAQDADRLATDYQAVQAAAQDHDLDAQTTALGKLSRDLGQLASDQTAFDAACGIPAITPTN